MNSNRFLLHVETYLRQTRRPPRLGAIRARSLLYGLLAGAIVICCLVLSPVLSPVMARVPDAQPEHAGNSAQPLLDQGKALYDAGQFQAAIDRLQQALQQAQGDRLQQALIFSNLSLAYQRLGSWTAATQAIAQSLNLLKALPDNPSLLAQALNIQGRLLLAQGQTEQAVAVWEQATRLYQQAGDSAGAVQSRINQAQALQALGLYRRSIALLTDLNQSVRQQPASLTQAIVLRQLGDALLVTGDLPQAQQTLEHSLAIAQSLLPAAGANPAVAEAVAAADLSLGNLTRTQAATVLSLGNLTPTEAIVHLHQPPITSVSTFDSANQIVLEQQRVKAAQTYRQQATVALERYQQAIEAAQTDDTRIQAQLNQLSLLIATEQTDRALPLAAQIQQRLDALPPSRNWIYDQIDLAESLLKLPPDRQTPGVDVARRLATASQQAATLGDVRAQSYALGSLGGLYEQTRQWQTAQTLTQQALMLSQSVNAIDISYRWQWQLGRLQEAQADPQAAIAAYSEAVKSLQALRGDLIAIDRGVQFSFRESVEPVYRQLVDLLLRQPENAEVPAENLQRAREVIEGLQVAELDNFFREACLDTQFQLDRVVDRANLRSAVFYTIVLPDRIEMILKLPQQGLKHYMTPIPQATVETTAAALLSELKRPLASQRLKQLSSQLYQWLIYPATADLKNSQVETIVFVLDSSLRSLPMSALYDGQHYLIEQYSVALAPGLQLPNPQPLQPNPRVLIAGLSAARENFPPLAYVETEVKQIQSDVPSRVLLDQDFTRQNFEKLLNASTFSIVHIATHGQFSSNAAETFILAWDSPININDLSDLLQSRGLANRQPIELLVLSACRTAVGDKRAALGLAGVAVRAGARSTVASLWNVDDQSSAALMGEFYRELVKSGSKAEALQHAQQALLANPAYHDPRSWASFVLLGNWL